MDNAISSGVPQRSSGVRESIRCFSSSDRLDFIVSSISCDFVGGHKKAVSIKPLDIYEHVRGRTRLSSPVQDRQS